MIGVVVAAHGGLAEALVSTARLVLRNAGRVLAVDIGATDDSKVFEQRLAEAVRRVQSDEGVLVLTDMFGGTPSNVGLTMHDTGRVELLTGANLAMVIKAIQLSVIKDKTLEQIAREVKQSGEEAIVVASEMLGQSSSPATTPAKETA